MTSAAGVNGHRWQKFRQRVLQRDRYQCTRCGSTERLEVHHLHERRDGGEDRLDLCTTLCHDCHVRDTNASNQTRRMRSKTNATKIVPMVRPQNPMFTLLPSLTRTTSHGGLTGHEDPGSPRFWPEPHPDAVGTHGGSLATYARDVIGQEFLPWQRDLSDIVLEFDADGRFCRQTWLLVMSRQVGKSTWLRALAEWRASRGGMVLSASAKLASVQHLMRPSMMRYRNDPDFHILHRAEQPEINWPNHTEESGRWISQAANAMLGRSFSADTVIIDEIQDCPSEALAAVRPVLTEVDNPLTILCGTGSRADSQPLLVEQRKVALAGGIGHVEWSAQPGSDWLDEETWREASPRWTPARLRRLREDVSLGEPFFRSEYLAQIVSATGSEPWLDLGLWERARADLYFPDTCDVAAVEDGRGGQGGSVALAWSEQGIVYVTAFLTPTLDEAWRYAARAERVLCGLTLKNESQAVDLLAKGVGRRETSTALPELRRLLTVDGLSWDGDDLDAQVRTVTVREDSTGSLVVAPNHPSNVMRAAAWAVQSVRISREPVLV